MAVAITWTDLTSREFRAAGSRSHDARAARRMVAVASVPWGAPTASRQPQSCGMDRRALRDWLHRYNEEGLAARRGVTPLLDAAQKAALVRAGPGPETHGVVGWRRVGLQREIERRLGVTMQERTAGRQFAALGFRRLSVRPPEIRPAGPGGVWKLCRQGTGRPARCGARQENQGVAPAQSACRPAGRPHPYPGRAARDRMRMDPHLWCRLSRTRRDRRAGHAIRKHRSHDLAKIWKTVAEGTHAILAPDGAGRHGARALRVPDNITLLPLPPYAPQINPVENVRACLRANKTATVRLTTTRHYANRINI